MQTYSKILDLGCGVGRDSAYFAKSGHKVVATDLSEEVIEQNKKYFSGLEIDFRVSDLSGNYPFEENSFDLVYAYLSLHYFNDETTKKIIKEIHRVTKPEGYLVFSCKTVFDPHYGKGKEIEKDMFLPSDGHVRHFFSEEYANEILNSKFQIISLKIVEEVYDSEKSSILQCIARKV